MVSHSSTRDMCKLMAINILITNAKRTQTWSEYMMFVTVTMHESCKGILGAPLKCHLETYKKKKTLEYWLVPFCKCQPRNQRYHMQRTQETLWQHSRCVSHALGCSSQFTYCLLPITITLFFTEIKLISFFSKQNVCCSWKIISEFEMELILKHARSQSYQCLKVVNTIKHILKEIQFKFWEIDFQEQ